MELDVNMMVIYSLATVIFMLLVYIAWRFREEHVSLGGLQVDDFLSRVKDVEHVLQRIRESPCLACGSKDKDMSGNLFEDNEITLVCRDCGARTMWSRGKRQWAVGFETGSAVKELKQRVQHEKVREK